MKFEKQCKIILNCLDVKKEDRILIISDKKTYWLSKELVQIIFKNGNRFKLVDIPIPEVSGVEPPKKVADEMLEYDVIIAPTSESISHTKATRNAVDKGIRVATLPGINKKIMEQSMLADYDKVEKFTFEILNKMKNAKNILVTTSLGTNFKFSVKGRGWRIDTGKIKSFGNLPGGEVFIAPFEGTSNGKIVVDCFENDGEVFANKGTEIIVKDGEVSSVSDKKCKISKLFETVKNGKNIAEFGIGTNYKAKLIGNILQDEKCLGTCHIAFGTNFSFGGKIKAGMHVDTILRKPTIKIDEKVIMKNGKFS